jgi:hypothetical protein
MIWLFSDHERMKQTMSTPTLGDKAVTSSEDVSALSKPHRKTLAVLFRHPLSHNLEWSDVTALLGSIGTVEQKPNSDFVFRIGDQHQVVRKPHTKDFAAAEIMELRHFLSRAGWAPQSAPLPASRPGPDSPDLLVAIDHHEAKIYQIGSTSDDVEQPVIRPYDPHHFLHHLAHKDQSRERGQRAPEDATFYERIAQAIAPASRIVVVGHGQGQSNAADHLTDYLGMHHREIYQRIVGELVADLSAMTAPQLLGLARGELERAPRSM